MKTFRYLYIYAHKYIKIKSPVILYHGIANTFSKQRRQWVISNYEDENEKEEEYEKSYIKQKKDERKIIKIKNILKK